MSEYEFNTLARKFQFKLKARFLILLMTTITKSTSIVILQRNDQAYSNNGQWYVIFHYTFTASGCSIFHCSKSLRSFSKIATTRTLWTLALTLIHMPHNPQSLDHQSLSRSMPHLLPISSTALIFILSTKCIYPSARGCWVADETTNNRLKIEIATKACEQIGMNKIVINGTRNKRIPPYLQSSRRCNYQAVQLQMQLKLLVIERSPGSTACDLMAKAELVEWIPAVCSVYFDQLPSSSTFVPRAANSPDTF